MAKNGEKIQKYTIFCQKNQKSKKKILLFDIGNFFSKFSICKIICKKFL